MVWKEIIAEVAAEDSTSPGSYPSDSNTRYQAPGLAEGDQAWRTTEQSSRRAGSVLAWTVAALRRPGGRRPCRCFRAPPCRMVPRLLAGMALLAAAAAAGSLHAGLARDVIELEPAVEVPCSLGSGACTCAWEVGSTCFVAPGTEGSTLLAAGRLARSLCSPEYPTEECRPG